MTIWVLSSYFSKDAYTQIIAICLGTCCPSHEQWLLVSCSPVPHHVVIEGPLEEHGWFKEFLVVKKNKRCIPFAEIHLIIYIRNDIFESDDD